MAMLLFGLLLGIKHALEADHLAAVAALAGQQTSVAAVLRQGLAWSLGHASVLLLIGGVLLVAKTPLTAETASALEALVGVVLIVLGARILFRLLASAPTIAAAASSGSETLNLGTPPSTGAALGVGMLHGLAGSAALLLLALAESPGLLEGLGLIASFSVGSILGMVAMSLLVAYPLRELQRFSVAYGGLLLVLGTATILLGASLTWESLATLG